MKKIRIIVGLFIISLLIITSCHWSFKPKKLGCFEKENMLHLDFYGQVIRKFKDYENHNYNALVVEDFNSRKSTKIFFINEKSGSYNLINTEDTLKKNSNSLIIINISQKKELKLFYDCEE